jgi:hypothetical protein
MQKENSGYQVVTVKSEEAMGSVLEFCEEEQHVLRHG